MMLLFNSGDFRFIFAPFDFSGDVSDGTTSIGVKNTQLLGARDEQMRKDMIPIPFSIGRK